MFNLLLTFTINIGSEIIKLDHNQEYKAIAQTKAELVPKKIRYGPLLLNFDNLYVKGKNYIIEASTEKSNLFYLAINCEKSLINLTKPDILWRGWSSPKFKFEEKLLEDICNE